MLSKVSTKKHYVVLGAGISGLALGWYLRRRYGDEIDLTILESQMRVGGWIQTTHLDGFLFEQGPRSCRPYGAGGETLQLIEELELQNELIFASHASKCRYLYTDEALVALPKGVLHLPFSRFSVPLLKALWRDWNTAKGDAEIDESIAVFISRRLGKEIADLFFDPLISGIYAGDISKLSMKSCFPQIHAWEQHSGSLLKGAFSKKAAPESKKSQFILDSQKKGLFTLRSGMEALTVTLAEKLKNDIRLGSNATALEFSNGKAKISIESGGSIFADHLFMAIPPHALASLLQPHNQHVANLLASIPSASVAVVNMGYRQQKLKHQGFGYLVPSKEQQEVLGAVWDSSAFPTQNRNLQETRLTVMIGESHLPKGVDAPSVIENIALNAVSKHMGIVDTPDSISIKIAKEAIPQYHVGHAKKLQEIESGLQQLPVPITLLGNGFFGVAVNDCIAKAKAVVFKEML